MLPRVGAALAQFVSPLDSAASKPRTARDFERAKPRKEPPPEQDKRQESTPPRVLKAVPKPAGEPSAEKLVTQPTAPGASVAAAFLELYGFIQATRSTFLKALGRQAYREGVREQKKAGRFRKGTMLDRRAG